MKYTDEEKYALKVVAKLTDRICDNYDVCIRCPYDTASGCQLLIVDRLCEDAGVA